MSWIALAIPNNSEQLLVETKAYVRIDALAPISSGHGLKQDAEKIQVLHQAATK